MDKTMELLQQFTCDKEIKEKEGIKRSYFWFLLNKEKMGTRLQEYGATNKEKKKNERMLILFLHACD